MTGKSDARPAAKSTPPAKQREAKPPAASAPTVHRAGGWIDRGDGRGWELEE